MNRKIIVFLIVGALIVPSGFILYNNYNKNTYTEKSQSHIHKGYANVQQLVDAAELIVIVEPVYDITEDKPMINYTDFSKEFIQSYSTLRTVKIKKVLKGNIIEDLIQVHECAALTNGGRELLIASDYSVLQKNKKYILFLQKAKGSVNYGIMSINQGKFNIDGKDDKEKSKEVNDPQFQKLKNEVLDLYSSEVTK